MSTSRLITRGYGYSSFLIVTRGFGASIGDAATVAWKLDIVNTNRSIAAQDVSRDIGFLERNKEVSFDDG